MNKLAKWLELTGKNADDVADAIGVHYTTFWRYLRGEQTPRKDIMNKIKKITDGFVTANDFYGD